MKIKWVCPTSSPTWMIGRKKKAGKGLTLEK